MAQSALQLSRTPGSGTTTVFVPNALRSGGLQFGSLSFEQRRDYFGSLLGKPRSGCSPGTTFDQQSFVKCMDLMSSYKQRTVEYFGQVFDNSIYDMYNVLTHIAPILPTSDLHFEVHKESIMNAQPFTEIAECGIPEDISACMRYYRYSWKESVRLFEQSATISRDLAMDPNFGEAAWEEILSTFLRDAALTINMNIISTIIQVGYQNMVRATMEGHPIDVHKLYLSEAEDAFIMARNPEAGLNRVRNIANFTADTLILPKGGSRYIREILGESTNVLTQKLLINPDDEEVLLEMVRGPDSVKTLRLGNQTLNIFEFEPFALHSNQVPINPLRTLLTTAEYYQPNPFSRLDTCVKSPCADALAMWIADMGKDYCREALVTMKDKLTHALYWDCETGKVSQLTQEFIRELNKRRATPDCAPWDWNPQNPRYMNDADINKECTDNAHPIMEDVEGKTDLCSMPSWRNEFVGVTYVPSDNSYRTPVRFGDFHLRSIPNEVVAKAARTLVCKAAEKLGISDLDEKFEKLKRFASAMRHAEWTDDYLFGLLDKNAPRMIARDDTADSGWSLKPEKTPASRIAAHSPSKFPHSTIIDEMVPNRFGGLDLPDKDGSIQQVYPAGMNNGAGWMTLAAEALKGDNSLWSPAAKEAEENVEFARFLLKFVEDYIGKTDVINAHLIPPWIHKESKLIALIDSLIRPSGPVFLGIPDVIGYEGTLPNAVPTQKVDATPETPSNTLLRPTSEEARQNIIALTAGRARKIVTNEERVFSTLSPPVYAKLFALTFTGANPARRFRDNGDFIAEYTRILHVLYDYVVELSYESAKKPKATSIQAASILVDAFVDLINRVLPESAVTVTADNVKEIKDFMRNFEVGTLMQNFFKKQKAVIKIPLGDYGVGFVEELHAYEDSAPSMPVRVTAGASDRPAKEIPIYSADYDREPAKYIRAPLTSSQELRDYLRNKAVAWVLPADSKTFYEYAEDPRIVTSNPTIDTRLHGSAKMASLTSLAHSVVIQAQLSAQTQMGAHHRHHQHHHQQHHKKYPHHHQQRMMGADQQQQQQDDDLGMQVDEPGDLFASMRTSPTSKSLYGVPTASKLLSMGKSYKDDDQDPSYREAMYRQDRQLARVADAADVELENAMTDTYFGPWAARLRFIHHDIKQLAERFFFNAIIQAKNRLEVPVKLSQAGAEILQVLMMRPFIQNLTDAMVAAKAGNETLVTTIGHSHVQVSKELRGCWHISVGFRMGVLKMSYDNIALFPHAFPVSIVGGKNTKFMKDLKNWHLPSYAKESLVGFLIPVSEQNYASPMHPCNRESYIRPGVDYAVYNRKASCFGAFYEFLMRRYNIPNIDALNCDRQTYASCVPTSHIIHRGPCGYIDPHTERKHYEEGIGPMGSWSMNWPGAQYTYEGRYTQFPVPNYNNQAF